MSRNACAVQSDMSVTSCLLSIFVSHLGCLRGCELYMVSACKALGVRSRFPLRSSMCLIQRLCYQNMMRLSHSEVVCKLLGQAELRGAATTRCCCSIWRVCGLIDTMQHCVMSGRLRMHMCELVGLLLKCVHLVAACKAFCRVNCRWAPDHCQKFGNSFFV